jgi:hypothetical protein
LNEEGRIGLLESIEKGHLNAVILGIGSIRIGGANKVGRQRRSNFLCEIVGRTGMNRLEEILQPVTYV